MEYYELIMTTSNPSADKKGNFSTREKAEAEAKKWEKIVKKEADYYGPTTFEIEKRFHSLYLDEGID